MIMELKNVQAALERVKDKMKSELYRDGGMIDGGDIRIDYDNREERYQAEMLSYILEKLSDADYRLEWMAKPIKVEGALIKREDGRYEIEGTDIYFTSGKPIEVLKYDESQEEYDWVYSRVEHSSEDYYIVTLGKQTKIDGLKVRTR